MGFWRGCLFEAEPTRSCTGFFDYVEAFSGHFGYCPRIFHELFIEGFLRFTNFILIQDIEKCYWFIFILRYDWSFLGYTFIKQNLNGDKNVKGDLKIADKWRGSSINGHITPSCVCFHRRFYISTSTSCEMYMHDCMILQTFCQSERNHFNSYTAFSVFLAIFYSYRTFYKHMVRQTSFFFAFYS